MMMEQKYFENYISDELWEQTKAEIGKYGQQIGNDNVFFNNTIGASFQNEQYCGLSIKRVNVVDSRFKQCLFDKCAATGSEFRNAKFMDCEMLDSNFQYVNFSESIFKNEINESINMFGCNFCDSNFTKTVFENLKIQASSFSQSIFMEALLNSCEINSCTMEGASFHGTKFRNMVLTNLNVEYADFTNASFENVYLPLMQLPYTFGGMNYYFYNDGLKLRSYENQVYRDLSKDEYKRLLFYLSLYYQKTQQYFPLANISLLNKEKEKFHEYVMLGIKISCMNKDLRDLKHLVKLIKLSDWYSSIQLRSLYFNILDISQLNMGNPIYLREFKSHFGEIYSLLGQQKDEDIIVRFVIDNKNKNKLTTTSQFVDDIVNEINDSGCDIIWKNVEISKNSPVDVIVSFISTKPDLLVSCIGAIGACLFGALQLREARKNNKKANNSNQRCNINTQNLGKKTIIDNSLRSKNVTNVTNITNITIYYQGNVFTNQKDINIFVDKIKNQLES